MPSKDRVQAFGLAISGQSSARSEPYAEERRIAFTETGDGIVHRPQSAVWSRLATQKVADGYSARPAAAPLAVGKSAFVERLTRSTTLSRDHAGLTKMRL